MQDRLGRKSRISFRTSWLHRRRVGQEEQDKLQDEQVTLQDRKVGGEG
jgi:hypothetical protein